MTPKRSTRAVLAALLYAVTTQPATSQVGEQSESALEMANICRPIAVAPRVGEGIYIPDKSMMCWGAFSAFQWAFNVYTDIQSKRPVLFACIPPSVSRQVLVAAFISYVDKHPETMHLPYQGVVASALQAAYLCKK